MENALEVAIDHRRVVREQLTKLVDSNPDGGKVKGILELHHELIRLDAFIASAEKRGPNS